MVTGFTGSRKGMTVNQLLELGERLEELIPCKAIHGSCIGADTDFHDYLREHTDILIEIYPSNIESQRALCVADIAHPPEAPLVRNRHIVDNSDVLIAAPSTLKEEKRSGTWATIRYAHKCKKRVVILRPEISTLEGLF